MIGFLQDTNSVTCSHSEHPRRGDVKTFTAANTDSAVSSTHERIETLRFNVPNVLMKTVSAGNRM